MPWRVANATASSLVAKLSRTWARVSAELVQPINGSITRGWSRSYSSTQSRGAMPCCIAFPAGFVGSLAGAALVLLVRPDVLRPVVLALLVGVGLFFAARRGPPKVASRVPPRLVGLATAVIAVAIGAYDGFFGPGTGTFLILAFTSLLGDPLMRASAEAKVVKSPRSMASVGTNAMLLAGI